MDLHFVPTEFLLSTDQWLSGEALAERVDSPAVGAALRCDGLLTSALQKAYGLPSSVELRRQAAWVDEHAGMGLRRDVLIKAGETGCVAAATLMPQRVIARHPWLPALGSNPLGETLEKRDLHRRGAFEFKRLKAEVIFPPPSYSGVSLWARRYRFFLAGDCLLVTEIFFPGALERLGASM